MQRPYGYQSCTEWAPCLNKVDLDLILMGCPCHIAHNTAGKSTEAFCDSLNNSFDVEELIVDIFFHFDYSSKRKNLFAKFCSFCDQNYAKIIKFHSVRWLGLSTCIEWPLKLFPSLKSYFTSQNSEIRDSEKQFSGLNRLIVVFGDEMLEVYLTFLHGALLASTHLFEFAPARNDPNNHLLYAALFNTSVLLLSRFMSAEIVTQYCTRITC